MAAVLARRTRRICLVLEDIFQPHNAAACLRSCDAFGVQDVHFIINRNDVLRGTQRGRSGVAMGSERWLSRTRWGTKQFEWDAPETAPYEATTACLRYLQANGYRVVATTLREDAVAPEAIPMDKPIALLIGSEAQGLSETAHQMADMAVQIPMSGFVQSLNLSVCAALLLRALSVSLEKTGGDIYLPPSEAQALHLSWLLNDISGAQEAIDEILK